MRQPSSSMLVFSLDVHDDTVGDVKHMSANNDVGIETASDGAGRNIRHAGAVADYIVT
jgi:hypothetical protein